MSFRLSVFLFVSLFLFVFGLCANGFASDNSHWSRQFSKPAATTKMSGSTGMSDSIGKPTIKMAWWNSAVDFSSQEAPLPEGADKPFDIVEPAVDFT
ncbi:MAG: hypothetical protein HUN05_04805 [Desulfobacter sp.]|nr:MAG: hypothetical protein HUN05_04805 [Desulfobacter sp.]